MGKLGKKARKFAKKNLQSVLRNRRKTKALFKKRASKKGHNDVEEQADDHVDLSNIRSNEFEGVESTSLNAPFTEDDKSEVLGASDSDGYLSEDLSCPIVEESESAKDSEDEAADNAYLGQNRKIRSDLATQQKKLDRLRKKDPKFRKFLESYSNDAESFQNEDLNSDEDLGDLGEQDDDDDPTKVKGTLLTNNVLNSWNRMLKEDSSQAALRSMLNAYRAACRYGVGSIGRRFENSKAFSSILHLMLSNADNIFQGLLFSSNSTKDMMLDLKKASKWKNVRPLVKSYVRSTTFLFNQVNDEDILAFAIMRVRASLFLFIAFPSLMPRLIKATVNLWIAGGSVLSSASFLLLRDVSALSSANHFETCLSRTFVAFISRMGVAEIADIKQMNFLRDCIVELCSIDVRKSSIKASASINQLVKILTLGLQTKKKEVKKICSWAFVNCIDIWVRFISANIRDYDLQSLFYTAVQLVNGVAHMFPGPRHFPLRLKCIEWLNCLSRSTGTFIPLVSLVLDVLEYKIDKEGRNNQGAINVDSILKLPKHYLKSRSFQDECYYSALHQLSVHFSQWSYHISFPDLATIPLIRLRKIHDLTTVESLRRAVKRFIDQVEQNVEFVERKRDEVPFSPHDHQSVDSFLQLEKPSLNTAFMQYYRSVMDKAVLRSLPKHNGTSFPEKTKEKRSKTQNKRVNGAIKS